MSICTTSYRCSSTWGRSRALDGSLSGSSEVSIEERVNGFCLDQVDHGGVGVQTGSERLSLVEKQAGSPVISRHVLRRRGHRERFRQLPELACPSSFHNRSSKPWPGGLGIGLPHAEPSPEVVSPRRDVRRCASGRE